MAGGARSIAAALGGGLALIDFDGDGDLDLFVASPAGQRLFRNDGRNAWTDVTAASGVGGLSVSGVPMRTPAWPVAVASAKGIVAAPAAPSAASARAARSSKR